MTDSDRSVSGTPNVRRLVRNALVTVLGVLLVIGLFAAFRLVAAARDLQQASDLLEVAGQQLDEGDIAGARDSLDQAGDHLVRANGALHNHAELDVVGALPVAGDNLRELRDLVGVAYLMSSGGERILTAAAPLAGSDGRLEVPLTRGAIPIDAVEAVQRETDLLASQLPGTKVERSGLLLGPVDSASRRVHEEVNRRRGQLGTLSRALALAAEMSGGNGPRRYVIAVANTAEMRGSGGMVLSYGSIVGRDGDFELEQFGRIDEVALAAPLERSAVPTVPDDYLARWEGFDPLLRWRNATMAGDFTVDAPVLAAMYQKATGRVVNGVIQVDPEGLAAILEGTGPVQVPEVGLVGAENVVSLVLNEAYLRFPGVEERSDVLSDVAEATFRKLVDGEYDSLRPLGEALVATTAGRHLLMWTSTARTENNLRALGADGSLPDSDSGHDVFHLTAQNLSANKLDYYLDTSLTLRGERPADKLGRLHAEVTLTNTAPPGVTEPVYIFGPTVLTATPAGIMRSLVTLYLPQGTSLVGVEGDALLEPASSGAEGGRPFVTFTVDIPAGEERTVDLELSLAPPEAGGYQLEVVPSPRVRPTELVVDVTTTDGVVVAGTVTLDRSWRFTPGAAPAAVPPLAFR